MKYGGSSLSSPEKIKSVALKVVERKRAGFAVAVVVSAMGDTTDTLLNLARAVGRDLPPREVDMLLTTGEQVSTALLSMAIAGLGEKAVSLTGPQAGIITCLAHNRARIVELRPERVRRELARGRIAVVAGFQGRSDCGELTTLGRGGSDTSAVALAAALGAEHCEICSDVDGVYSADPRLVPSAIQLGELGYEEMIELARCGARVLNVEAVEVARRSALEVRARSSFSDGAGTMIRDKTSSEPGCVRAVAGREDLLWVRFRSGASRLEELLSSAELGRRREGEVLISTENMADPEWMRRQI